MLGMFERRGLRVGCTWIRAAIGMLEDVESFGIGRHDAVLDAVVDHLDEMAGAVRSAVQVALLGRAIGLLTTGSA